ncbi:MAG: protease HtpX, partial [Thermoprotei archaeon]
LIYILQWIISPYVIDAMYKVRPADPVNYSWLHQAVKDISMRSGIKTPRLMIADISIPNAFAYGNMLTGYKVAVTRGLLSIMPKDEVVAVIGHELGHIKHKDVAIMMIVGLLPAVILWIGEYLVRWGWLFGFRRDRDSLSPLAVVGIGALFLLIGFLLNLGVLYLSRLREYYADAHSALSIPGGAKKLQRALARIMLATGWLSKRGINPGRYSQLKMLFIEAPEHTITSYTSDINLVIEEIKSQKPSLLHEIFSTHPHPAKRFRFLDKLYRESLPHM